MGVIILDLDGTLADTIEAHIEAARKALKELGYDVPKEELRKRFGIPLKEILNDLKIYVDYEEVSKKRLEFFDFSKIKLIDGAEEFLVRAKMKHKLALVTNTEKKLTYKILEHLGIKNYFDLILTRDDVRKGKPDVEPYVRVVLYFKEHVKNCIAIGDSIYDLIPAKRLGMKAYGVLTGVGKKEELEKIADAVFENILQIPI